MQELKDRTAVITGAASGIGLALARRLSAAGMRIMLADIESGPLDAVRTELADAGHDVDSFEIDVREHDQLVALDAATRERFGNVHLLCNNAGVVAGGPIAGEDDLDMWRWAIDINLWGVIHGCKAFLPAMVAHGERAHVVNTASMAGLGPSPLMAPYTISKYGVVALTETLSLEMQMTGANVGVSVLCPAFVKTGIADSKRNLPAELADTHGEEHPAEGVLRTLVAGGIEPADVAAAVEDAVRNDAFWIITHEEELPRILARAQSMVDNTKPTFTSF